MSSNPAPWREQLAGLGDDEISAALEPTAADPGLLHTRQTLDEDEEDHTDILAPDLGGEA